MSDVDKTRKERVAEAFADLRPDTQVELGLADGTWIAGIVAGCGRAEVELDVRARFRERPQRSEPPQDLPSRGETITVTAEDVVDVVIWIVSEGPE
jgi:hypothetical protein